MKSELPVFCFEREQMLLTAKSVMLETRFTLEVVAMVKLDSSSMYLAKCIQKQYFLKSI